MVSAEVDDLDILLLKIYLSGQIVINMDDLCFKTFKF